MTTTGATWVAATAPEDAGATATATGLAEQVARRERRRKLYVYLWRSIILIVVLASWQLANGNLLPNFVSSSPTQVADRLWEWIQSGYLLRNLKVTLQETLVGFLIGTSVGYSAGILLGVNKFVSDVTAPFVNALYAIPKLMLGPLFVVWFGIDTQMKTFLAALFAVFIVFYNIWSGVQEVDNDLIDMFRVMGAKKRTIITRLYMPSALSWLFTSLRLAFPVSMIGAIVGEFIASSEGVGFVVTTAANTYDTPGVFAVIIAVTIVAVIADRVIVYLQQAVSRRYGREGGRLVI